MNEAVLGARETKIQSRSQGVIVYGLHKRLGSSCVLCWTLELTSGQKGKI